MMNSLVLFVRQDDAGSRLGNSSYYIIALYQRDARIRKK